MEQKIRLGLTGQTLGEIMDFEALTDLALSYGIRDLELWPVNVPGEGLGYRKRDLEPIKEILARKDMHISCVTEEAAFIYEAVADVDLYKDILLGTIDAAAAVGAPLVNHYCYFINLEEKPDFGRMELYWGDALEYARTKGITLVLENEAHDVTRHPETMAAIVEHFGDEAFKTNLDAVNYFHASEEGFPAAYEILKPHIGYIHLKNACLHREGVGQDEKDLGAPMSGHYEGRPLQYAPIPEGSVNIDGLISAVLRDDRYHGTLTLEPHTTPERVETFVEKETAWLKDRGYF